MTPRQLLLCAVVPPARPPSLRAADPVRVRNSTERHSWAPFDYSILELAVKGKTAKTPDPLLTDEELKAIRERLTSKQYEKVRGTLEKKG